MRYPAPRQINEPDGLSEQNTKGKAMLGHQKIQHSIAGVDFTPAKTNQNNNFARSSGRDHRDHQAHGDLIRRQLPRSVEACDLPSMFQPVIQSAETLSGATSAEALCQ